MIEITDDTDKLESCEALVCMRAADIDPGHPAWPLMATNIHDECVLCHHEIVYRPHNPKKPPKVCLVCFMQLGPDRIGKILNGELDA